MLLKNPKPPQLPSFSAQFYKQKWPGKMDGWARNPQVLLIWEFWTKGSGMVGNKGQKTTRRTLKLTQAKQWVGPGMAPGTTEKSPVLSSSHPPVRYFYTLVRCPQASSDFGRRVLQEFLQHVLLPHPTVPTPAEEIWAPDLPRHPLDAGFPSHKQGLATWV